MAYLPHSDDDRRAMLEAVGVASQRDLFATVPSQLLEPPLELPPPLSEQELVDDLSRLAARNRPMGGLDCFLGAGVYRRFIPSIVRATIARPEFYTAYTPYQAEASQGTLQTIFEFQSMICALTGLDVANASLYDGATAAAEGALLAVSHTGRRRVLVASTVHPETLAVLRTYGEGRRVAVDIVDAGPDGLVDGAAVTAALTDAHAAVLVAQPSFLGTVADLTPLAAAAHAAGALLVVSVDPMAQSVLVPVGEQGADVAVGEAQQLGIPASYGGPHCGFMAVRQTLVRRMPGRLVGMTVDHAGRRAYTLTLQTREQHIRRENATSNICTNHALMALAATAYMARMGTAGMRKVVEVSAQRAHHLAERLATLPGVTLLHPETPWLYEFAVQVPGGAEAFAQAMRERGIVAGLPLDRVVGEADPDTLLVCCTETTSPQAIERYVEAAAILVARSRAEVGA
jgi:glycine cleavage system P protein (glycine dehydrogenase) subunit 1